MDWLKKRKEKKKLVEIRERGAMLLEDLIQCCDGKSNPIRFFSADQIIKATNNFSDSTNNFSDSNLIYELKHPAYRWYSGNIDNRPMMFLPVYVSRDYCRNIAISSMVSGHKNFMKLLGCCLELEKPVIVYDFMKISWLGTEMVVSWRRRIKIAEDIATGLAYLHTAFPRPFVYRAMNLDNIFLGEDGVARLGDFSNCISIPQGETFVQVKRVVGSYAFLESSYASSGIVSEKLDVYGIGILLQMLLIGLKGYFELRVKHVQEETRIDGVLSTSWEERSMEEIADPEMLEKLNEVGEEELCQMKAFIRLSLRCIGLQGEVPNMVEVAKELKKIQKSL